MDFLCELVKKFIFELPKKTSNYKNSLQIFDIFVNLFEKLLLFARFRIKISNIKYALNNFLNFEAIFQLFAKTLRQNHRKTAK